MTTRVSARKFHVASLLLPIRYIVTDNKNENLRFIFGITSQSMFPNGVVYEGVSETPLSFRGESGANDSMVRIHSSTYPIIVH